MIAGDKVANTTEVITALRYGCVDKNYILEAYTGTADGNTCLIKSKYTFQHTNSAKMSSYGEIAADFAREDSLNMTLEDLNILIIKDSQNNLAIDGRQSVYWWVDVAMKVVSQGSIAKYIANLGLPNDDKFCANFGMFDSILPAQDKFHIYPGNGQTMCGSVSSVTFFLQTMWIKNIPIDHCFPQWIETILKSMCGSTLSSWVMDYYRTRLAFLFTTSNGAKASDQRAAAYLDADFIAQVNKHTFVWYHNKYHMVLNESNEMK